MSELHGRCSFGAKSAEDVHQGNAQVNRSARTPDRARKEKSTGRTEATVSASGDYNAPRGVAAARSLARSGAMALSHKHRAEHRPRARDKENNLTSKQNIRWIESWPLRSPRGLQRSGRSVRSSV